MRSPWLVAAVAVLLPYRILGVKVVNKPTEAPKQLSVQQKVQHLVVDIDESIRKAGGDSELVYASLYAYDHQLERGLTQEIGMMNASLVKLANMVKKYGVAANASESKLQEMDTDLRDSNKQLRLYETGEAKATKSFDSLLRSVSMLVSVLQSARVTEDGMLVSPEVPDANGEPLKVYSAIRRLLAANKKIAGEFIDVYQAFVPKDNLRGTLHVQMTPLLLQRTLTALKKIQNLLYQKRSAAMVQMEPRAEALAETSATAVQNVDAQQEAIAEKRQTVQELSFSMTFTQAALKIDRDFLAKVQNSKKVKADLVDAVRTSRQAQLKTLKDLSDLLLGKYSVDEFVIPPVTSFVQTKSVKSTAPGQVSNLQVEIEDAIRKKQDTHGILLKIQTMLDNSAPIDADSVQSVVAELGNGLQSVEGEESEKADAKQRCKSQVFEAQQLNMGLNANLAVMGTIHNHTSAAIGAARNSLHGIAQKSNSLEKASKDFPVAVEKALKSLGQQSTDRMTMMTAVQKAGDIMDPSMPMATPAVAFLRQLLSDLGTQEKQERAYRQEEHALRTAFLAYTKDYLELLRERRSHYENTISSLELYGEDVASDATSENDSLSTGEELKSEVEDLCDTVAKFYQRQDRRRKELSESLRAVMPEVPKVLGASLGLEAAGDSQADDADDSA